MNTRIYIKRTQAKVIYRKLLDYSLRYCDRGLFVVLTYYNTTLLNPTVEEFIGKLKPFGLRKETTSKWPGGGSLYQPVDVYDFALNQDSLQYLYQVEDFFNWRHPNYPEDLCLLRPDGSSWLTNIAHEQTVYLDLTESEFLEFRTEFSNSWSKEIPEPIGD